MVRKERLEKMFSGFGQDAMFLKNLQDLRGGKSCLSWRLCCRQEVAVVMRRKTTWVRLNKRKSKDAERNASGKVMRSGYTEFLAMK